MVKKKISPGDRFARLLVIGRAEERHQSKGRPLWKCKCDCGNTTLATTHQLNSKNKQSCGCLQRESRMKDITGQTFGYLKALESTGRTTGNAVIWRWECRCGAIIEESYDAVVWKHRRSCGCRATEAKRIQAVEMQEKLLRVEGTSVNRIKSQVVPRNSTTGVLGVTYRTATGKYVAQMGFQGKKIHIGSYDTLEEAALARKKAEEKYYQPLIEKYTQK